MKALYHFYTTLQFYLRCWLLLQLASFDHSNQSVHALQVFSHKWPSIRSSHTNSFLGLIGTKELWISHLLSSKQQSEIDISSMTIREIKAELGERNIAIENIFEKEELVRRLAAARQQAAISKSPGEIIESKCIQAPLYFLYMDQGVWMDDGGINLHESVQLFVKIQVQNPSSKGINGSFTLSLLIDTACSSFILKPSVCAKYKLPLLNAPATLQGVAGIAQQAGLVQLQQFTIPNINQQEGQPPQKFGPLPGIVQEVGGIPSELDGAIGVLFFNQFAAIEFDFCRRIVSYYKEASFIPRREEDDVVVDTKMQLLGNTGIYTVPVYFGGRGPVNMLVDTGATGTVLNWRGVADMGLNRGTSPQISRISIPTGIEGSLNEAIELTHRLYVSSTMQLGDLSSKSILSGSRLEIDIGDIPVIDALPGVGGILGIDALMKCGILRISTRNPARIIMFR